MNIQFVAMTEEYGREVIDIFNYYIENSITAYPEQKGSYEFYGKMLEMTRGYPAKTIKAVGGRTILASISSLNQQSLSFHRRNGFVDCGRFVQVARKKGTRFDVVWMQKTIR